MEEQHMDPHIFLRQEIERRNARRRHSHEKHSRREEEGGQGGRHHQLLSSCVWLSLYTHDHIYIIFSTHRRSQYSAHIYHSPSCSYIPPRIASPFALLQLFSGCCLSPRINHRPPPSSSNRLTTRSPRKQIINKTHIECTYVATSRLTTHIYMYAHTSTGPAPCKQLINKKGRSQNNKHHHRHQSPRRPQ